MFGVINKVTKKIQEQGIRLAKGRAMLNGLIQLVSQQKNCANTDQSPLGGCRLGTQYISATSAIVSDPHFESGVVKIQQRRTHTMTAEERDACQGLLHELDENHHVAQRIAPDGIEDILNAGDDSSREDEYINCDFILASTAEVERLWSLAKYVLTDQRSRLEPVFFKSLLFLKENRGFWDQNLVS